MAVPNMSEELYNSLTKWQKIGYWVSVITAVLFICYFLFFY